MNRQVQMLEGIATVISGTREVADAYYMLGVSYAGPGDGPAGGPPIDLDFVHGRIWLVKGAIGSNRPVTLILEDGSQLGPFTLQMARSETQSYELFLAALSELPWVADMRGVAVPA